MSACITEHVLSTVSAHVFKSLLILSPTFTTTPTAHILSYFIHDPRHYMSTTAFMLSPQYLSDVLTLYHADYISCCFFTDVRIFYICVMTLCLPQDSTATSIVLNILLAHVDSLNSLPFTSVHLWTANGSIGESVQSLLVELVVD